jgi:hypothetical protein
VRSRWGRGDVHALAADLKTRKRLGQGASAGGEDHRQADTDAMLTERAMHPRLGRRPHKFYAGLLCSRLPGTAERSSSSRVDQGSRQ